MNNTLSARQQGGLLRKIGVVILLVIVTIVLLRPGVVTRLFRGTTPTATLPPADIALPHASTTPATLVTPSTPVSPFGTPKGLATSSVKATALFTVGATTEQLTAFGKKRSYIEYIPASINTNTSPINVLVVLHGTGGTGNLMRGVGFDTYADQSGFVTVYPDSLLVGGVAKWDPTYDLTFLQSVVSAIRTQLGARMGKLYVVGMSNGAMMTQVLGCAIPEVVGIAPLSASINNYIAAQCTPTHPLQYIGFYGTEDRFGEIDKYEQFVAFFSKINGCTSQYASTQIPDSSQDGTTVELRTYLDTTGAACATPVHYYRITGGGHFWPGVTETAEQIARNTGHISYDINATALIVDFFGLAK
jgi:polyhydroxybutyrate depolymerase